MPRVWLSDFHEQGVGGVIEYTVELESPTEPSELEQLVTRIDLVAEIPRALRQGARVRRTH